VNSVKSQTVRKVHARECPRTGFKELFRRVLYHNFSGHRAYNEVLCAERTYSALAYIQCPKGCGARLGETIPYEVVPSATLQQWRVRRDERLNIRANESPTDLVGARTSLPARNQVKPHAYGKAYVLSDVRSLFATLAQLRKYDH